METLQGKLDLSGLKIAIVVSRWNEFVTKELLEGAIETLESLQAEIVVAKVSGTWEIPPVAAGLLSKDDVAGCVALGCILQGATTHAALLSGDVSGALMSLQMSTGKPISWGILTPENQEQAIERAGMKLGNKGREAALAVAESISLLRQIG